MTQLAQIDPAVRVAAATGGTWVQHHRDDGLLLQAPADWLVAARSASDFSVREPSGIAAAMVRGREVPLDSDLADWLWLRYPHTEPGLHQVRMRRIENLPAQAACAVFDYGSPIAPGRASALAVRHGRRATVFVAAALQSRHAHWLPLLLRVLDSSQPCPGGITPAARRALLARLLRLSAEPCDP
ncbi:MAG: hypothetical protein U1E89_08920 [Burkholderiaceae bacterium]